ncbi:hypothetical protein CPB84DRAFT_1759111 [Gymnopilus junonius]|uniref:Uncharacterized protein n=1 Tax=Gymnopilus junonius TaxID=109634 RepID=A0A9P5P2U0_GYMJU|nr:hypothetical protein CPB84DRAFT_1759111 [Gymnopilus junonius]
MKFFVVIAAVLATAVANQQTDQSAALKYLLTTVLPATRLRRRTRPPGCYWDGTAPFCAGSCPTGYTEEGRGSCGDGACCWTGYKFLCCKTPPSGEN